MRKVQSGAQWACSRPIRNSSEVEFGLCEGKELEVEVGLHCGKAESESPLKPRVLSEGPHKRTNERDPSVRALTQYC